MHHIVYNTLYNNKYSCQIYLEPKSTNTLDGFTKGTVVIAFVLRPSTGVGNNIKKKNQRDKS